MDSSAQIPQWMPEAVDSIFSHTHALYHVDVLHKGLDLVPGGIVLNTGRFHHAVRTCDLLIPGIYNLIFLASG